MILKIVTPHRDEIIRSSVDHISLHLSDGYPISIYPGHIQLAAILKEGKLKYTTDGQEQTISVSRGLLLVENDVIICYVSWADPES